MSQPTATASSNSSLNSLDHSAVGKKMPINKVTVGTAKGPNLKNVKSKIGSLNNVHHKPAGGEKKIESQKLKWETKSRVGSLENATHKPQGGNVKVVSQKLDWNVKPKIGSLDNIRHQPGGGNVKIFDEKYVSSSASACRSGETTPGTSGCSQEPIQQLLRDTNNKLKLNC